MSRINIIGIIILTLAVITPEAALADWKVYYTGDAARMFGSGGRGSFATRAQCEAYNNSRPPFERNNSYCSGFDTPSSSPPAANRRTPAPSPPIGDGGAAARDKEEQRQLQLQREEQFSEDQIQLLGTLKGTGTGTLGLKTGSPTTNTTPATTSTNPLGLKTGSTPVPAIDPRILSLQEGMRQLRTQAPPPLTDASLSFEKVEPNKTEAWLMNAEDFIIYAWSVKGRIGGKVLPWTNLVLVAGKVVLAGADGAQVYLIGQDRLYDDAARYLKKDPAIAEKFARLLQNLRQGRPVSPNTDPAMLRAANAILDPKLNHTGTIQITWDLLMTPEAKMAMVRRAVFEAGMYYLGEGSEGIVSDLKQRGEVCDAARTYRNLAQGEMKDTTSTEGREVLQQVSEGADSTMTELYKDPRFLPKTASYVEGLIIPDPRVPGPDAKQ